MLDYCGTKIIGTRFLKYKLPATLLKDTFLYINRVFGFWRTTFLTLKWFLNIFTFLLVSNANILLLISNQFNKQNCYSFIKSKSYFIQLGTCLRKLTVRHQRTDIRHFKSHCFQFRAVNLFYISIQRMNMISQTRYAHYPIQLKENQKESNESTNISINIHIALINPT